MLSKNLITNKHYKDGVEITVKEYDAALREIKAKAELVNNICNGTASIDNVPTDWLEDIQRRVEERTKENTEPDVEEANEEDYRAALSELGVSV